jgi:hypothetical protein
LVELLQGMMKQEEIWSHWLLLVKPLALFVVELMMVYP